MHSSWNISAEANMCKFTNTHNNIHIDEFGVGYCLEKLPLFVCDVSFITQQFLMFIGGATLKIV